MNAHRRNSSVMAAFALCLGLGSLHSTSPALAAAGTPKSPATNANPSAVERSKSAFIVPSNPSEGRDPFFPLSRRLVVEVAAPDNGEKPKVTPVTLALKGVSGTESKRFALINDKTFAADEESEITIGTNKVRVHCIEIREDSVTVEVNGNRQELRLRPGL